MCASTACDFSPANSVPRFHVNPQRGYGLVEPVYRACLKMGKVAFHWNTRITALTQRSGRVAGVEGRNERTGAAFALTGAASYSPREAIRATSNL